MHRLADERTRPGLDVADRQRQDTGTAKLDDQDAHAANSHVAVSSEIVKRDFGHLLRSSTVAAD